MAYIPPHKRHSKGSPSPKPTPAPESLIPTFRKNLNFKSSGERKNMWWKYGYAHYAPDAVFKWFSVGLPDHSRFSSLVTLQPFSTESFERKSGDKPLTLVLRKGCNEGRSELMDKPWVLASENVKHDLLLRLEHVKREMVESALEEVKPTLVARFGKILFYGSSPNSQESVKSDLLDESILRQRKRSLCTNITPTYMEYMENLAFQKLDLEYEQEKELYYVKLSDNLRSDATVFCKCVLVKDHNKIQLHKIKEDNFRHMVTDISCLVKSLDLRLMLYTKKIRMALSDEEIIGIKDLIGSAILDPEVKGGLRWPFGKDFSGGRYTVIAVWHTTTKSFRNSSIRLKLRHADRFDFINSTGDVAREIILKMPGIRSQLRKQTIDENLVFEMLEDNLKLIWDHCLVDGSSS